MEGKTTRKTYQVLDGEDEGEEHGADRGLKKVGEQKWQFSYGERAVLHRADENEDAEEEEEEEEHEEEVGEEESTALAQVYTTTTSRLLKTFY